MWRITDKIWLGNSADGYNQQIHIKGPEGLFIPNPNKTHLTLCVANDLVHAADVTIGLTDGPGNPKWKYAMIAEATMYMSKSDNLLVYCHEGRSRSVCSIASYLLYSGLDMSFPDGIEYIRNRRNDISPNPDLLEEFLNSI